MRRRPLAVPLAALLAALAAATARGAAPALEATVSAKEILAGDTFTITVSYSGEGSPAPVPVFENPDAAHLFRPTFSQSHSWINGVSSSSVVWTYEAAPEGEGEVRFGEVRVNVGGRQFAAPVPVVRVVPPAPQPHVRLSLVSDRAEALVGETFTVTLAVDVRRPELSDRRELAAHPLVPNRPPHLDLPLFSGADFGPCRPDADPGAILQDMFDPSATGFRINDFAARTGDLFDMGRRPAVFAPRRGAFEENGTNYVRYAFSLPMRATGEGSCSFPAARFRGSVVVAGDDGRASVSRDLAAFSNPLEVRVVPPPEEGRPKGWFGGLGSDFAPEVSLDVQHCVQGDPLKLTLSLRGLRPSETLRAPDLFANLELAADFRQYAEPERRDEDGTPRFVYRIRPTSAGSLEIPPLALPYFDVESRAYRTVRTDPVAVRADPAPGFDAGALAAAGVTNALVVPPPRAADLPSALSFDPAAAAPRPPFPLSAFLAALLVPPALFALAWGVAAGRRARRSVGASLRRGSAPARAASRMRSARTPQEALDAVRSLLRDRYGEDVPGLTPGDVAERLSAHGIDAAPAAELGALLQAAFDESFRPGADPAAAIRPRRRRLAALLSGLRALVLCAGLFAAAAPARAAERAAAPPDFLWRQTCSLAARARETEDFLAVARLQRELLDAGAGNAVLLHDHGICLLLADRPAEALDALLRAEALCGATPELEHDLALAYGTLDRARTESAHEKAPAAPGPRRAVRPRLPWHRTPLFWHHRAPLSVRRRALAAAWTLLWAALFALRFAPAPARRVRRAARVVLAVALLACALLATSVFVSERILAVPLPPLEETLP